MITALHVIIITYGLQGLVFPLYDEADFIGAIGFWIWDVTAILDGKNIVFFFVGPHCVKYKISISDPVHFQCLIVRHSLDSVKCNMTAGAYWISLSTPGLERKKWLKMNLNMKKSCKIQPQTRPDFQPSTHDIFGYAVPKYIV